MKNTAVRIENLNKPKKVLPRPKRKETGFLGKNSVSKQPFLISCQLVCDVDVGQLSSRNSRQRSHRPTVFPVLTVYDATLRSEM